MRRAICVLLLLAALMAIGVNVIAFMQARAMTHFAAHGKRTKPPEELSAFDALRVIVAGVSVPRPTSSRTPADVGLGFAVRRFDSASGATLESWYVPGADDSAMVLAFHGYAALKADLLPVAKAIHDLGYPSLMVDFYGSGGSSGTDTSLGYLEAQDVTATVQYARRTWPQRRLVLYGFSMGGAALLRGMAVDGFEPDGIILEATFDRLLNTAKNRFRTMGLPATPFAQLLLFWGGIDWGFDPFAHNPVDYARAVTCPALILHGDQDARVPLEQARQLAHASQGARLEVFPGVGHMLIVNARPQEWKAAVRQLIARASSGVRR